MDSYTKIYVQLLDEGTFVLRPTQGKQVQENTFIVLETSDYDPTLERWMFLPGCMVECEWDDYDGESLLVAKRLAT